MKMSINRPFSRSGPREVSDIRAENEVLARCFSFGPHEMSGIGAESVN